MDILIVEDQTEKKLRTKKHKELPPFSSWLPKAEFWYFPASVFYLEIVYRFWVFGFLGGTGWLFIPLFSLVIGAVLYLLCSLGSPKVNRIVTRLLMGVVTLLALAELLYYQAFTMFPSIYSLQGAGQVFQFVGEIIRTILKNIVAVLLLLVPLVLSFFSRRLGIEQKKATAPQRIFLGVCGVAVHFLSVLLIFLFSSGAVSPYYVYTTSYVPEISMQQFGMYTSIRLDLKNLIFPAGDDHQEDWNDGPLTPPADVPDIEEPDSDEEEKVYDANIMDIDFDALIASEQDQNLLSMHQYFSAQEPSMQNEYTGMFKGKNLIFITAEGFSQYAIDPVLTPTLYKMANEGFVFTNFYNPIWGVSTSDGEYVACTGLIPKTGVWSFYRSSENDMPFCMGNQLARLGYDPKAYHNHTYTYYHRDVSHPNMGYDYKGLGNGLEVKQTWPESDLEMIEKTVDEYINDVPFHAYYMTVSGHLGYTFNGNAMSTKHKDEVADLPYSEGPKAYIACNIEFDRAMEELLNRLEEAGQLEDTLIVISPDHYPYGLSTDELNELAGHTLERNFELYKSQLIMWSAGIEEPVQIDKLCSSLDILPTISNLMGVEYDSRLLMGRDILSDSASLVIFSNRSWMTDAGSYNALTNEFILNEGVTLEDQAAYVEQISAIVRAKFAYSAKILETDYYHIVLPERCTH